MKFTYVGAFDDYNFRLWENTYQTVDHINHRLVSSVLFGNRLLVNDGFIGQHLYLKEAIYNPHLSPFRKLVDCGWLRILTRNKKKIDEVLQLMVKNGVGGAHTEQSANDMCLREALASWADVLKTNDNAFEPFSAKDLTKGFTRFVDLIRRGKLTGKPLRIGDAEPTTESESVVEFLDGISNSLIKDPRQPARTLWEQEALSQRNAGKLDQRAYANILRLGALVHQSNVAATLAATREDEICVDTQNANFLQEIFEEPIQVPEGLPPEIPRVELPSNIPWNASEWEKLAQIARVDTTEAGPVLQARSAYLKQVMLFLESDRRDKVAKDMREAARDYSDKLTLHFFEPSARKYLGMLVGTGLSATGGVAGFWMDASPAFMISTLSPLILSQLKLPGFSVGPNRLLKTALACTGKQLGSMHDTVLWLPEVDRPVHREYARALMETVDDFPGNSPVPAPEPSD